MRIVEEPDLGASLMADLPRGLEQWIVGFIQAATAENTLLQRNGALDQATARACLLHDLVRRAREWMENELDVKEAAQILDVSDESVRRAVRDGRIPDRRKNGMGRHRPRRGDVLALKKGNRYNPAADAQDIAKLRRAG
jgi:hypothetical protein